MRQTSIHVARHSAEPYSVALQYCTFNWLSQKTVGDGEKLLTYFNSTSKVLLGADIFLLVLIKT
jgi:hypothetical protein